MPSDELTVRALSLAASGELVQARRAALGVDVAGLTQAYPLAACTTVTSA